jgi:hypothetical protein
MDPKPLKVKPKKNTYGRGWHGEDDGRATIEELHNTNPQSASNEKGGLLKNLFVRQVHPSKHLYKTAEVRAERFGIPLEQ